MRKRKEGEKPCIKRVSHLSRTIEAMRHRRLPIDSNEEGMSNEDVLCEIRHLFESFDKDLDQVSTKLAYLEGTVNELKQRDGNIIKILMALVAGLLGMLGAVIAHYITLLF